MLCSRPWTVGCEWQKPPLCNLLNVHALGMMTQRNTHDPLLVALSNRCMQYGIYSVKLLLTQLEKFAYGVVHFCFWKSNLEYTHNGG